MKYFAIILSLFIAIILLDKIHNRLPFPFPQIHKTWMAFSRTLGIIMSNIILTIIWIFVFGPYAIIWKITVKKEQIDYMAKSYWIDVPESKTEDMKYQF